MAKKIKVEVHFPVPANDGGVLVGDDDSDLAIAEHRRLADKQAVIEGRRET